MFNSCLYIQAVLRCNLLMTGKKKKPDIETCILEVFFQSVVITTDSRLSYSVNIVKVKHCL